MEDIKKSYQRFIFMGMVIIDMGITFSTTMSNSFGTLGVVFIAIGGLFFIIGMHKKKLEDNKEVD